MLANTLNTMQPTTYCIGCYKKLDYIPDIFTTCGNQTCLYKTEHYIMDDTVTEYIKNNFENFKLLLSISSYAITSKRYTDLFDPYPNYFLDPKYKSDIIEMKRGSILKLNLSQNDFTSYNNAKQIERLKKIITTIDIKKIQEIAQQQNDKELARYSMDTYQLLRFIIKSGPFDITIAQTNVNITIYKINHMSSIKKEFAKKHNDDYCYMFHGSASDCWHSIIRNGIKIMSDTSFQFNGKVHGNGIYMSSSYSYAKTYSRFEPSQSAIVGVYQVCRQRDQYKKTDIIYVVPTNDLCQLKYLIVTTNSNQLSQQSIEWIDRYFAENLIVNTKKEKAKMKKVGSKKLMIEYNNLMKQSVYKIELVDSNIMEWIVSNGNNVKLHITFPEDYPFSPPFIRILSPRFVDPKYITSDGAICCEYLTKSNWLPTISIENLIIQIYTMIIDVNNNTIDGEYDMTKAIVSYDVLAKGCGWI